jgi:hypothetical protein
MILERVTSRIGRNWIMRGKYGFPALAKRKDVSLCEAILFARDLVDF